jgi:hypothetical protein
MRQARFRQAKHVVAVNTGIVLQAFLDSDEDLCAQAVVLRVDQLKNGAIRAAPGGLGRRIHAGAWDRARQAS